MDIFQQQTAAFFMRRWIENAIDNGDMDEALAMSLRLDELTLRCLQDQAQSGCLTGTAGMA